MTVFLQPLKTKTEGYGFISEETMHVLEKWKPQKVKIGKSKEKLFA